MIWKLFPAGPRRPGDRRDWRRTMASIAEEARDFRRGAKKTGVVIHALILREARTRYGRRSAGYVWALLVPLMQLTVMIAVFSLIGRGALAGGSLPVFFLTGIIPVWLWRNSIVRATGAIQANKALLVYPQVRPFEVITARTVLELLTSFGVFIIFALALLAFFETPLTRWIDKPLDVLGALGALGLLSYGSSYLSAQIGRMFEPWKEVAGATGRIMFFTSGVWFTFASIPAGPREWIRYNPLAHVIEWLRDGAFSDFSSDLFDPMFPVATGVLFLALGLFIDWMYRISGYDLDDLT